MSIPVCQPTLDHRWLVFAALSNVPRSLDELCERADLSPMMVVRTLVVLGDDGLAHLHNIDANEWSLSHDAS